VHRRAVLEGHVWTANTEAWAHIRESKNADGGSWPEWTGEQPYEHPSNRAREDARERLGQSITVPDYTQLVNAMADERIGIAAEMVMAHLSIHIRIGHALQKEERWAVGEQPPRDDIAKAERSMQVHRRPDRDDAIHQRPNRRRLRRDPRRAIQTPP
jgi:hypothetical protein